MSALSAAASDEDGDTIHTLRAAIQQAIDWISEEPGRRPISAGRMVAVLVNALAEAPVVEQEPVAEVIVSHVRAGLNGQYTAEVASRERLSVGAELFVHPQPLQPLTDEEIGKLAGHGYNGFAQQALYDFRAFARAIERAHGIGGEA